MRDEIASVAHWLHWLNGLSLNCAWQAVTLGLLGFSELESNIDPALRDESTMKVRGSVLKR